MATVEEAARGVVAALNGVPFLLATKWVADRYKQVFAKTRARHLRRIEQLYVPARINDGTATFTRDSDVVTGDATARAVWTSNVVGRYVRASVVWYKIDAIVKSGGNDALKIEKKFSEDTQTSVAYNLVQRFTPLPSDARWLGDSVVSMRRRRPLLKLTIEELNIEAPARDRVGSSAEVYCEAQDILDADGKLCRSLEIYPYYEKSEVYAIVVYPMVPTLRPLDQLPPGVDEHVVKEGALVDAYRWKMAVAIEAGQVEQAAVWRNEFRTQETKWQHWMMDAIRADKSVDDLTFILKGPNSSVGIRSDIINARDVVYDRWPR